MSGDSVLATSLPSFGQATIQATRPDALTGANVVIGVFSGSANSFSPFSVNSTTPTPLSPSGDCWQKGALSQALTPDLQPGDTIRLTQAGFLGSSPSSTSVVVQPPGANASAGPIAGCSGIAPWARNAITSGPSTVTDGPVTVSGVAQPLATGVSLSASDGTHTTTAVSTTPATDGSWTATIPAAELKKLGATALTVKPVMAVPDVSTGAQAHIAGVGLSVKKSVSAPGTSPSQGGTGPGTKPPKTTTPGHRKPGPTRGSHRGSTRVSGLRAAASLTLASARRDGITASFVPPAGARMVRVELLHGKSRLFVATVSAHRSGSRQTVVLRSRQLARVLRAGVYTIAIQAGTGRSAFGPVTSRTIRIR